MDMGPIKESLTFDDVMLMPRYSDVLPSEVSTTTKLEKNLKLKIPLMSSAMDTVTESRMAIEIGKLGGIGIIVIAIAIFPILKIGGMQLFQSEFSAKEEKVLPRTTKIATGIGLVYIILTLSCSFLLFLSGMDIFDSVAHGMTIIATGGFSTKDMSIGFFDSLFTEIITIFFMIVSSLPFILLFQSMRGKLFDLISSSQVQFFLMLILTITIIVSFWLKKYYEVDFLQSLRISAFAVVSISTGSGFSTYDFSVWGSFTTLLFLFLMLIGGCSGSSSCGLKIFRIQILFKSAFTIIKKIIQ